MRKKIVWLMVVLYRAQPFLFAQSPVDSIKEIEVAKIIRVLASDSLHGRGNGTPDLLKAGLFIGQKFEEAGLYPLVSTSGYYIPFRPFGGSKGIVPDELIWNEKALSSEQFVYLHPVPGNYISRKISDFTVIHLDSFFTAEILNRYNKDESDLLLWTSEKQPDQENYFPEQLKMPAGGLRHNILLVYAVTTPDSIGLSGKIDYYSNVEYNVISMLPGRSKPGEVILFSAHYDHQGVYPYEAEDSIMNGANDDASGVTALLILARYFSQQRDNERTIIFCAFAGEELGLLGSQSFMDYINPERIMAVINIEMIGVPQYGKNTVFITGQKYSTLPSVLIAGLKKAKVKINPEPDAKKMLFSRSDNFSFARKGIPAHTIMTSDDDDPCYHKPCDEVKRINLLHLTNVIKAIASATELLINGEKTPTRINVHNLY